jgi:hypothetical protein
MTKFVVYGARFWSKPEVVTSVKEVIQVCQD